MSGPVPPARWHELAERFGDSLASFVRNRLQEHGLMGFNVSELAADAQASRTDVKGLLDELVAAGVLTVEERELAACAACAEPVTHTHADAGYCPSCGEPLDVEGDAWRTERWYVRRAPPARDVSWVLVVHGMNTRGTWQERLAWRVATTYRRSVPVYIHKYGKVTLGVLLRWRQRQLADQLAARIREIAGRPNGLHLGSRPDVIAHSFGTWLIAHALRRHPNLDVGRVILVGGVVRPDFDWAALIREGRVEAVLNHFGTRDRWVPIAQFLIPDTGPSGTRGLRPADVVLNCRQEDFGHSTFFVDGLAEVYDEVWKPFLLHPAGQVRDAVPTAAYTPWRPAPRLLRATLPRLTVIATVVAVAAWVASAIVVGSARLADVLFG